MNPSPRYTEFHPRWHRRPMTTWWWLGSGAYFRFILRELSSAFIAWFVALTIAQKDVEPRVRETAKRISTR